MDAYTLLQNALAADPGRPLLTMYDDHPAPGSERIELSVITFANWVNKTANYLLDELMLEPGEPVGLLLPPHWQTAAVQVAVLAAGGHVTAAPARITFWAGDTAPPEDPVIEELVGLALRPMGLGFTTTPPEVRDYSVEVRGHGDRFAPRYPQADVEVLPVAERILTDRLDPLLEVLAGGGSLVLCRRPDPEALAHRAEVERVTATLGLDVEGLPRLDA